MIVVTGTATFAWLKLNPNAYFDDMEISISSNEDLKISIFGEDDCYRNSLNARDIKIAVVYKAFQENIKESFDMIAIPDGTDSRKVVLQDKKTGEILSDEDVNSRFQSIKLGPVTTTDGINFADQNGTAFSVTSGKFIEMDIYFRAEANTTQDVYFSNREIIYEDGTIIPKTELGIVSKAEADLNLWSNVMHSFDTYDKTTGALVSHNHSAADSEIAGFTAYASDAARFAVTTSQNPKARIYEINEGFGSYATQNMSEDLYVGATGAMYDRTKNAALTYYNWAKKSEYEKIPVAERTPEMDKTLKVEQMYKYEELPFTYKGFDSTDAAKILTLDRDNDWGSNGSAKMTIKFWLEGWDADCSDMVLDQALDIKMSFTNYANVVENEPVTLTYNVTDPDTGDVINNDKKYHQIVGMPISDHMPAYTGNADYKFKGWAMLDENGNLPKDSDNNVILWDFATLVKPKADTPAARQWVLQSVWEHV